MKNKSTIKKTRQMANPFLKALLSGFAATVITWLLLTTVFSLVLSRASDHNSIGPILSVAISVISIAAGGFVLARTDKSSAFVGSVILSAAVLGLAFGLSEVLDLTKGLGAVMKTVHIASIFVAGIFGARLGSGEKSKRTHRMH